MAATAARVFADANNNGRGARVLTGAYDERLDMAVIYVRERIALGTEYPDAEWQAGVRFGVKCDDIRAAYDNQEGTR